MPSASQKEFKCCFCTLMRCSIKHFTKQSLWSIQSSSLHRKQRQSCYELAEKPLLCSRLRILSSCMKVSAGAGAGVPGKVTAPAFWLNFSADISESLGGFELTETMMYERGASEARNEGHRFLFWPGKGKCLEGKKFFRDVDPCFQL